MYYIEEVVEVVEIVEVVPFDQALGTGTCFPAFLLSYCYKRLPINI